MKDKESKSDLFADERIVVTVDADVGSGLGKFLLSKQVPEMLARKIVKLLMKTNDKIKE